jgi:hypothetical protein
VGMILGGIIGLLVVAALSMLGLLPASQLAQECIGGGTVLGFCVLGALVQIAGDR